MLRLQRYNFFLNLANVFGDLRVVVADYGIYIKKTYPIYKELYPLLYILPKLLKEVFSIAPEDEMRELRNVRNVRF